MTDFPSSVPVKAVSAKHPDYDLWADAYGEFRLLYRGGVQLKAEVTKFLRKRPKELSEVYTTRQANFSYTNLLGNVIGWYTSALWKTPPQFYKGENEPADVKKFCDSFEKDCNRAGKSLIDFWADVSEQLLLYKTTYVLVDLPGPSIDPDEPAPISLKEQEARGLLDPFLVQYAPDQVINWECDSFGNLEWCVVYARLSEQEFLKDRKEIDCWYYFDRQECALYTRDVPPEERTYPSDATAKLVPGYPRPHALAKARRVPLYRIEVKDGLWLGNRVALMLVNHLNMDNSLDFGLFQGNLSQMVIEDGQNGEYQGAPTNSEVSFHRLPHGGKMFYLEPTGTTFTISQERLDVLEERIYKACYLQDQSRTNASTPTAQSGWSKQLDKMPGRDALSGIGDVLRPAMQKVYQDALDIRGFNLQLDVRGLDFTEGATSDDLQTMVTGSAITVNSRIYEREVQKKAVRLQLPDANPEMLAKIDQEIEANPTPSELEEQRAEQQREAMAQRLQAGFQQVRSQSKSKEREEVNA